MSEDLPIKETTGQWFTREWWWVTPLFIIILIAGMYIISDRQAQSLNRDMVLADYIGNVSKFLDGFQQECAKCGQPANQQCEYPTYLDLNCTWTCLGNETIGNGTMKKYTTTTNCVEWKLVKYLNGGK